MYTYIPFAGDILTARKQLLELSNDLSMEINKNTICRERERERTFWEPWLR